MKRLRDLQFWSSAITNRELFNFYLDKIMELTVSLYDWQNVPETVNINFLETELYSRGSITFFKDPVIGYLALPYTNSGGKLNVYRIPVFRHIFAANGYQDERNQEDSVIIYNNAIRSGSAYYDRIFAKKLAQYDSVIDINVNAQKTPILLRCSEAERLTLKNLYMKYDGNQPVIFGDKNLSNKPIESIKTDAPYVADEIYYLKTQYWNEMLTYKGITNVNIQKKERMITDEVLHAQGGTTACRYSGLDARQTACKMINKMFGLDMWVEYKDGLTLDELLKMPEPPKSMREEGEVILDE